MQNIINRIKHIAAALGVLIIAPLSNADFVIPVEVIPAIQCDPGFIPYATLRACVADNLPQNVISALPHTGHCGAGRSHLPGTPFCLEKNTALSIKNNLFFIRGYYEKECPQDTQREPWSRICTSNALALEMNEGELHMIAPREVCPNGSLDADLNKCKSYPAMGDVLFAIAGPQCPPGFIKPPGVHFCVSNKIAFNGNGGHQELPVPSGPCPVYFDKRTRGGFCVPDYYLKQCSQEDSCGNHDNVLAFEASTIPLRCPRGHDLMQVNVPANTSEIRGTISTVPMFACGPVLRED